VAPKKGPPNKEDKKNLLLGNLGLGVERIQLNPILGTMRKEKSPTRRGRGPETQKKSQKKFHWGEREPKRYGTRSKGRTGTGGTLGKWNFTRGPSVMIVRTHPAKIGRICHKKQRRDFIQATESEESHPKVRGSTQKEIQGGLCVHEKEIPAIITRIGAVSVYKQLKPQPFKMVATNSRRLQQKRGKGRPVFGRKKRTSGSLKGRKTAMVSFCAGTISTEQRSGEKQDPWNQRPQRLFWGTGGGKREDLRRSECT